MRWLDALAYSSVWVALAAGALCAAAAAALSGAASGLARGLAACGTLVVYNVDRLRDLPRDRATAPERSAFVARHRPRLLALAGAAAAASVALAWALGPQVVAVLLPVLGLGLLHRRLKALAYLKPFYIALAWVVVTVGVPAVVQDPVRAVGWVVAIFALTILANVIACNVRDGEAASAAWGEGVPLQLARVMAGAAVAIGLLAPQAVRPLVLVPLATLGALVPFHPGERYGHLVVDGALLAGALGALVLL